MPRVTNRFLKQDNGLNSQVLYYTRLVGSSFPGRHHHHHHQQLVRRSRCANGALTSHPMPRFFSFCGLSFLVSSHPQDNTSPYSSYTRWDSMRGGSVSCMYLHITCITYTVLLLVRFTRRYLGNQVSVVEMRPANYEPRTQPEPLRETWNTFLIIKYWLGLMRKRLFCYTLW